jgi:hypothetical protein
MPRLRLKRQNDRYPLIGRRKLKEKASVLPNAIVA